MEAKYLSLLFGTCDGLSLNSTAMRIGYGKQLTDPGL